MSAKVKDTRKRNWITEVYLDSVVPDWVNILRDFHIPVFISPLHDRDVYERDDVDGKFKKGDLKKPHHHIMLMFAGNKSYDQIKEITTSFNGVGLEDCKSVGSYARYLCHLDDPDKALYDPEDVISLGGADYFTVIELPAEKYLHIREMLQFCIENEIYSFSELSLYAMIHRGDWFRILVDKNTLFVKEFLKSRAFDKYENHKYPNRVNDDGLLFDPETGEVL